MNTYNIVIDLTGLLKYKNILIKSKSCQQIFSDYFTNLLKNYSYKKEKIELFFNNYETQTLLPLTFSTNNTILNIYNKLHKELIQNKEKQLIELDKEYNDNFNKLVKMMRNMFLFYIFNINSREFNIE